MQLDFSQIKNITTGAVRITEEADGIHFYRFTKAQEEMFKPRNEWHYKKTFSTAGIRLRFKTDSSRIYLKAAVNHGSPRSFFAIDIAVDGVFLPGIDNHSETAPEENFGDLTYPYGTFEKVWQLASGEKEICIYLPWSVTMVLQALTLDDGASLIPMIPEKKALCFGDSITHGADALYPRNRYISRFCDCLGAAEYCKAICGEEFWPELAATKEPFEPDYITVAYGTNDWSHSLCVDLREHCYGFFRNLRANYPDAKLIAITPLWRADQAEKEREVPLSKVYEIICDALKDDPNARVICGDDLVPHDRRYFADLRLHPNDEGFRHYAENLIAQYMR